MRKVQKRYGIWRIISLMFFILIATTYSLQINANSSGFELKMKEFSDEYVRYLELSDEEKQGIYPPRMYDIESSGFVPRNQLKIMRATEAAYAQKYSLRDTLPEKNLRIKNQKLTNMCWTFASLSSLETNLALSDYFNHRAVQEYDFSERHMEYATVRELGGGTNIFGFNRKIDGGARGLNKFDISYLTNGMGAINESDMPFEMDMSMQPLSYIQGKETQTQVYDLIEFPSKKTEELMNKMKNHIKNYGSINVNIHGAQPNQEYVISNGKKYYCYNNQTGAIYCHDSSIFPNNHAVSIIGWDDEFPIEKFNENNRPRIPGAWIIRNSWGTGIYEYEEMRKYMFEVFTQTAEGQEALKQNNLVWTSPSDVPNELLDKWATENGYTKRDDNTFYSKIGDEGIMYVSYDDCNIYSYMTGVMKAENEITYDNLYQYDELGNTMVLYIPNQNNDKSVWVGNIFDKKTSGSEYITQVSIYAPEKYTCKVWVNPNSDSKLLKNMVKAKLKDGESETFDAGYHTIEFAEPIEITSDKFFVALEIRTENNLDQTSVAVEALWNGDYPWNCVQLENNKTFINIDETSYYFDDFWKDLAKEKPSGMSGIQIEGSDSTLKVFTVNELKDRTLKEIQVTKEPDKTEYWEGESFDKTGMVVTGYLNSGETIEIKNYIITDGDKLSANQKSVTIEYEDKTTEQPIKMLKNIVEKLEVKSGPTVTTYKAGENFNKEGLVLIATFKNGETKEVTDFEVIDGNDLKNGQTVVNVRYEEATREIPITVTSNAVKSIKIENPPDKTEYVEGQDFDRKGMKVVATYEDGMVKEVTSYTVENGVKLTKDQTSVTIKFEDKTDTQEITVKGKSIDDISVKKNPDKTKYVQYDDELNLEGGLVLVKYNDGSSEEISMLSSEIVIEGFDNTKTGKNTIKIKYLNFETTFEIEIVAKVQELPENSDFSKATAKNKLMKIYYYTNNTGKEYSVMDIEISGIKKATVNDSLSYEYYLSANQKENTIEEDAWIKLENVQIIDGKLQFTINTKDVKNYEEISKANNLYLYVREIATRKGQSKELIIEAKDISKTEKKEEYIDGIKKENPSGGSSGGSTSGGDGSQATGKYPYTGKAVIIFAVITLITMGTIGFIKYKNIDK